MTLPITITVPRTTPAASDGPGVSYARCIDRRAKDQYSISL
jgi:hypothetical protein